MDKRLDGPVRLKEAWWSLRFLEVSIWTTDGEYVSDGVATCRDVLYHQVPQSLGSESVACCLMPSMVNWVSTDWRPKIPYNYIEYIPYIEWIHEQKHTIHWCRCCSVWVMVALCFLLVLSVALLMLPKYKKLNLGNWACSLILKTFLLLFKRLLLFWREPLLFFWQLFLPQITWMNKNLHRHNVAKLTCSCKQVTRQPANK